VTEEKNGATPEPEKPEVPEEPKAETPAEPAPEPAPEPTEEPAAEAVEEPTPEPAPEPTEEPVAEPVEEPVAAAEPAEESSAVAETGVVPDIIWGTGRRKSSVARVRLMSGTGRMVVNGRDYQEYFPSLQYQVAVVAPLKVTGMQGRYDVLARLTGGGLTGQAGALSLGIARGLRKIDRTLEEPLREHGLLTRDARMKERKKYGLHGARRGVQFSKR
jgi:small subunit ribosomal protein S9